MPNDDKDDGESIESLRARLVEEIDRRRDRDRELVEQRARADGAEAELANVRLTLAFGLGHALVEALHWRGLLRLPGRIRELRRRQAAKRGRLPGRYKGTRPADAMHLVDGAVAIGRSNGAPAARDWVAAQKATPAEKARALVETALALTTADPAAALDLGFAAATLRAGESRLFTLAMALYGQGQLAGPLDLVDRAGGELPRSLAMDTAIAAIRAERAAAPALAPRAQIPPPGDAVAVAVAAGSRAAQDLDALRAAACGGTLLDLEAACQGEALVEAKAGLLHIVGVDAAGAAEALSAAHALGIPVIVDVQSLPLWVLRADGSERNLHAEARLATLLRAADRVVLRSAAARTVLSRLAPDLAVAEIPADSVPGLRVAEPDLLDLRREFDLRPDRPVILCPVPLDDDPGLFDLVEAVAGLAAEVPEVTLLFADTGAAAPALARHAARCGAARHVLFSGSIVDGDIPALLSLARVAVFPRRGPGPGTDRSAAMGQAMAIGLPVVASGVEWRWRARAGVAMRQADDLATLQTALLAALRAVPAAQEGGVEEAAAPAALAELHAAVQRQNRAARA